MTEITELTERIDVFDGADPRCRVLFSFWWVGSMLVWNRTTTADQVCADGIGVPSGARLFPRDGRTFFEALAQHFIATGYAVRTQRNHPNLGRADSTVGGA